MPFKRFWVLAFGLLALFTHAHVSHADRFNQLRDDGFIRYQNLVKQLEAVQDRKGEEVLEACRQEFSYASVPPTPDTGEWSDVEDCYLKGTQPRFAEILVEPGLVAGTDMRALCGGLAREPDVRLFYDCYYDYLFARRYFVSVVKKRPRYRRAQCASEICGEAVPSDISRYPSTRTPLGPARSRPESSPTGDPSCFLESPPGRRFINQGSAEDADMVDRCFSALRAESVEADLPTENTAEDCRFVSERPTLAYYYLFMPAKTQAVAANFCRTRSYKNTDAYADCMTEQFEAAESICEQLVWGVSSNLPANLPMAMCNSNKALAGLGSAIFDWRSLLSCSMLPGKIHRRKGPKSPGFPILDFPMIGPFGQTDILSK